MYLATYDDTDRGFRADSGFMPRVDVRTIDLETDYFVYGLRAGGKSGRWFDSFASGSAAIERRIIRAG